MYAEMNLTPSAELPHPREDGNEFFTQGSKPLLNHNIQFKP